MASCMDEHWHLGFGKINWGPNKTMGMQLSKKRIVEIQPYQHTIVHEVDEDFV